MKKKRHPLLNRLLLIGSICCAVFVISIVLNTRRLRDTIDAQVLLDLVKAPADVVSRNNIKASTFDFAVFYNVFIPHHKRGYRNAMRIIQEQLQQVVDSYLFKTHYNHKALLVNYNTIGNSAIAQVDEICKQHFAGKLVCKHMQHYDSAFEEVTLQAAYQHCQAKQQQSNSSNNDPAAVIYMHNKGSFHKGRGNENWRRHMTSAVFSQHCTTAMLQNYYKNNNNNDFVPNDATCNTCGLQYTPIWASYYAGNFWIADCNYVAQLVPPIEYETKLTRVVEKACAMQGSNLQSSANKENIIPLITTSIYKFFRDDPQMYMGISRWASELWVGSHPAMRPCDVSDSNNLQDWRNFDKVFASDKDFDDHFKLQNAPHKPFTNPNWFSIDNDQVEYLMQEKALLHHEFFLLTGNIMKWIDLYNGQMPPSDSYYWTWFPDAEFWHDAVKKYVINSNMVHDVLTDSYKKNDGKWKSGPLTLQRYEFCRTIGDNYTL